jgi:hypothetical protein
MNQRIRPASQLAELTQFGEQMVHALHGHVDPEAFHFVDFWRTETDRRIVAARIH